MEQIIKIKRLICDECDAQVENTDPELGDRIFNGWIKTEVIDIPVEYNKNPKQNNKAFCSESCLIAHYQSE